MAANFKPTVTSMATKVAHYDSSIEAVNADPETAPAISQKKTPAKFTLGGLYSREHSAFLLDGSSGSAPCDVQPAEPLISESAIDSDTDDDCFDESAIDDYDSSDWEDSDSSKSSVDANFFQRVESGAYLVSRPSLITLMLARTERTPKEPQQQASHSAFVITAPSASPNSDPSNTRPTVEMPRSSTQPIVIQGPRPSNLRPPRAAMSDASQDGANLKQSPEKPYRKKSEDAKANSWINMGTFNSYHSQGW